MHANLTYKISDPYKDYLSRLMQFVKKNIWLYIPDSILLLMLILPPYSLDKAIMILTGLVLISFRDVIAMKRSARYLNHFTVEDSYVNYSILKYSKIFKNKKVHISRVSLVLEEFKRPYFLDIYEQGSLVHRQYAIGYWSLNKLREMHSNFNSLKKDMNLSSMFRGASMN